MPVLSEFSAPAGLTELSAQERTAWSNRVKAIYAEVAPGHPQFLDPTKSDTPPNAARAPVAWPAFPAQLLLEATSEVQRWSSADDKRRVQDEYCEWSVERDATGKLTRVTFTTEVPEYWEHIAQHDPELLLALYREFVAPDAKLDDLIVNGQYVSANVHNRLATGRLAHHIQADNNLEAAVALVAQATILRQRADGTIVLDPKELVDCGGLGESRRRSDPQIASTVNAAAADGNEVTFADPAGLYLDEFLSAGMETPDGSDAGDFWMIERGDAAHVVRARFEVPADRPYVAGDIRDRGRPLAFGAQLADRIKVRATALVKPADHTPEPQPCKT
jgi:hypothetical protein